MTRRSQHNRGRLSYLLLSAAPALLLAAAAPAEAHRSIAGQLRICETQDQRELENAFTSCSRVIDRESRSTVLQVQRALIGRAGIRATRGDLTGAAADLEQARQMGAESPAVLVTLGRMQARLNDPDGALASFATAIQMATANDRVAAFDASIETGAIRLERQQWTQALQAYASAYVLAPDGARRGRALIGSGHARLGGGDINGALRDYAQATDADQNSIEALLALADGYRLKTSRGSDDSFTDADVAYLGALTLINRADDAAVQRGALARAHAGRGDLYLQRYLSGRDQSDLQQASADFGAAVEADSQNVSALVGRAAVYTDSPATYQRAVADLERAVRLAPANAEILRTRGDLFKLIGDDERAMRDYDQSLQLGGAQTYRTYFQRGVIYINAGDYVRADQSFAAAEAMARHGDTPPGVESAEALAEALAMRSRASWNLIDTPGFTAREVALSSRNFADEAALLQPRRAHYQAVRCLSRSVAGGEWNVAESACRQAINLADQSADSAQMSEALGTMGLLQLRWALAEASTGATEATHLQAAADLLNRAVQADHTTGAEQVARASLYRYAQGVAYECLGRTAEANAFMRAALNADRSVEARFLTHRIRHCRT